jgi:hypothetical protein
LRHSERNNQATTPIPTSTSTSTPTSTPTIAKKQRSKLLSSEGRVASLKRNPATPTRKEFEK